jgi:hypothetical protein
MAMALALALAMALAMAMAMALALAMAMACACSSLILRCGVAAFGGTPHANGGRGSFSLYPLPEYGGGSL